MVALLKSVVLWDKVELYVVLRNEEQLGYRITVEYCNTVEYR